jgi:hypothetical protein
MSLTVSKESLNDLMDLQEDVASVFTQEHLIGGQAYWTCVECLAQTKLAELNDVIEYTPHQRF